MLSSVQGMSSEYIASASDRILVTGSNGFIGTKVVEILLGRGYTKLRCFVRSSSNLDRLQKVLVRCQAANNVQLVVGDLLCPADCRTATEGASVIYHLAAGMEKSFAGAFMNSALATRNLMDAFLQFGEPKRFVNVSSFAVYSNLDLKHDALLDETCPLEDAPQERFDPYGFGKLKQEELVREYGSRYNLPYVILRPGYVFGPGKRELNARVGIGTFGVFIQISGSNPLPLTFVDNCAEAIVLAGLKPGVEGETFNVVDDELPTGRRFLDSYKDRVKPFRCVRIPYALGYAMCSLWEKYSRWSNNQVPPVFNRRRCAAQWKKMRYSNRKLKDRLGWEPKVPMEKAINESNGNDDPLKRSGAEAHH
jgi:nucleoside-diphosphate-sugar epimerase